MEIEVHTSWGPQRGSIVLARCAETGGRILDAEAHASMQMDSEILKRDDCDIVVTPTKVIIIAPGYGQ